MKKQNIYNIESHPGKYEIFEPLLENNVLIERIISNGQVTPEGKYLSEETNEWVLLLQGNAVIETEEGERIDLTKGDYLHIPANTKHRVSYTSNEPVCIWLAIHGNL